MRAWKTSSNNKLQKVMRIIHAKRGISTQAHGAFPIQKTQVLLRDGPK